MVDFHLTGDHTPVIRQTETAECGLACIAMVMGHHGAKTSLLVLRQRFPISVRGASLDQLVEICSSVGFGTRSLRGELEDLSQIQLPAILHWNLNHFVVLEKITARGLVILDPAFGKRTVSFREADPCFTGIILELTPQKDFSKYDECHQLRITDLVSFTRSVWKSLIQALVLSLMLQAAFLATPLLMQFVLDFSIESYDKGLLFIIIISFVALKCFEAVSSTLRALVLQYLTSVISFNTNGSVFHHLVWLPLQYFHKRQIGDLQQRMNALGEIQNFLVHDSVAVIIDGFLVLLVGIVLFMYDPLLAALVGLSVGCYAALRLFYLSYSRRLSLETMMSDAEEQSHFLETLRAIRAIKMCGIERTREETWRNLMGKTLNANVRLGNSNILFQGAETLLLGIINLLVIYLAATKVIDGAMSVGMIVGFIAYKDQFQTKLVNIFEVYLRYRLLDVNLDRVADIVQSRKEENAKARRSRGALGGTIEIRSVSFAYNQFEPDILTNVSLKINPGECLALSGPSGAGKTTLLNVIAGILPPTEGEIYFDDDLIRNDDWQLLRSQFGVVMQDDTLLSGTIADNIALFDKAVDYERLRKVSEDAQILSDIERMPMGFSSLVGDMGASLSGGQIQRVLIARALYRKPRILFFDESTSQLDTDTEALINQALDAYGLTRIVVAHRESTIKCADRVIRVDSGTLLEVS
ncbi:MAG: peptidase domain-containing ABC transporter [Pseudomonadota bacterium]